MRRVAWATWGLLVLTLLTTAASAAPLPGGGSQSTVYAKGVDLAGKVSDDGKAFLAEDDNWWTISNPSAVKESYGQHVTVRCQMSPQKRSIRVLSVHNDRASTNAGPRWGDSAFRR